MHKIPLTKLKKSQKKKNTHCTPWHAYWYLCVHCHMHIEIFLKWPEKLWPMFYKTGALKNFVKFTGKYLCQSLFIDKTAAPSPQPYNFNKNETKAQEISCEFYKIFKNTGFIENLQNATSVTRFGS